MCRLTLQRGPAVQIFEPHLFSGLFACEQVPRALYSEQKEQVREVQHYRSTWLASPAPPPPHPPPWPEPQASTEPGVCSLAAG